MGVVSAGGVGGGDGVLGCLGDVSECGAWSHVVLCGVVLWWRGERRVAWHGMGWNAVAWCTLCDVAS